MPAPRARRQGRWRVWIEAARPRTLSAGIAPVLVGTAAAETFVAWRFAAALAVGLSVQVGVNYANDLFDAQRGVDTAGRLGPRRAVASGLVTPRQMSVALGVALLVAASAGLALALATTPWLIVVGLACFAALLGYSGGPRPYAGAGLGEVFVFVFFGVVATVGSAFVQDERIAALALVASVPVGLVAVAILIVNNLRDISTDRAAGKVTLAVRLGEQGTRRVYNLAAGGAVAALGLVAAADRSAWPALGLAFVPLLIKAGGIVRRESGTGLIPALGATSAAHLALGIGLGVGLWIS